MKMIILIISLPYLNKLDADLEAEDDWIFCVAGLLLVGLVIFCMPWLVFGTADVDVELTL